MRAEGVALVTGASRGIGRALAIELARRGFDVVATMRAPAAGEALRAVPEGSRIRVERLDVRNPGELRAPEGLRVLVNNAGVDDGTFSVEETPLEQWRRVFETNVFGLAETTRLAIPALRRSGGGVIVNLTSASLLFPMPFYAVYRASKAAVSALGESLRAELAPLGIRVVEILPGPIATDMLEASDRPPDAAEHAPYRALAERAHAGRQSVGPVTSAQDAARSIADVILDDGAPLRNACDPLGAGLLAGWRAAEDERWLRQMLAALGIGRGPAS